MPLARVGDVALSYERTGSGPPLLAIIGMSGSQLSWGEPFLGALGEHFEVIAYDHRGVGDSSRMERPFRIADLAGDAVGLLDELALDSVHVLGISMGGMVAQELALAHPARVRSLALGCTYCGGPGSSLASPAVGQRLVESLRSGDRDLALRTGWEICISPRFRDDDALYQAYLARTTARPVARAVILAQMQAIAAHDTSARLPGLEMPTLIVHGTADDLIPVENARVLAGYLPDARLEILEDAGHLFFLEEPLRSAELVRDLAVVPA
jgi:pimeloyl-ACP methyl ester carboxylesterase